jgi:hypothetical protein
MLSRLCKLWYNRVEQDFSYASEFFCCLRFVFDLDDVLDRLDNAINLIFLTHVQHILDFQLVTKILDDV